MTGHGRPHASTRAGRGLRAAGADAANAAWRDYEFNPATDTEGRNHFYRNGIKVRVTGEARVLDPGVAHTQIWIEDAAGFEVISQN